MSLGIGRPLMIFKAFNALLLTVLLIVSTCFSQENRAHSADTDGIIDLRKESFENIYSIKGKWGFFWSMLIAPEDSITPAQQFVKFPSQWSNYKSDGKTLPAFGYASYKVTILLPRSTDQLSIAMPETYTAYSLFLNGRLVASNGKVSTSSAHFVPHWQYEAVDVPRNTENQISPDWQKSKH
jgi:hypothetical protein